MRIVTATKPGPSAPAIDETVTERKPPAQPATITGSRIVTAPRKTRRHQQRGDAAVALIQEIARRATGDGGT
jgi:hypothetical protein